MKRKTQLLALPVIVLSIAGITTLTSLNSSNAFMDYVAADDGYIHVSTYEELQQAFADNSSSTNDKNIKIILDDDINLADFSPTNTVVSNNTLGSTLEIDGNGYSLYNKPSQYFFTPIISSSSPLDEIQYRYMYVHDLTFDNSGYLFSTITSSSALEHYGGYSGVSTGNSLYFQDITIENINLTDQIYLKNSTQTDYGLLFGSTNLYESGASEDDNALTLSDITIQNNTVSNNTIDMNGISAPAISWGLLGNVKYSICHTVGHAHSGYIDINGINISNNKVVNNEFINTTSSLYFSSGNLFGEFSGVDDWTGSQGNFLKARNIFVQDNIMEKPIGIDNDNFTYSELISNPVNVSIKNQLTSISEIKDVYIINNVAFLDVKNRELVSQENISLINISDDGSNSWYSNAATTMAFVGPNYNDPSTSPNIIANQTSSEYNDIYSSTYLSTSDFEYDLINQNISSKIGIYSYDLTAKSGDYLNQKYDLSLDPNQKYLTKVNLATTEEKIVVYQTLGHVDENDGKLYSLDFSFKYLQANSIQFDSTTGKVTSPYVLSDLKLTSNGNVVGSYDSEVTTTAQDNFVYNLTFEWADGIELSQFNLEDLYLSFSYNDGVKQTQTVSIKIQPDQVDVDQVKNGAPIANSGQKLWLILGITGIVAVIGILILAISYLTYSRRRRKILLHGEVQDGYYEPLPVQKRSRKAKKDKDYDENYGYNDESYYTETPYDQYYEDDNNYSY